MGPANANRLGYPYSYNILLAKRHGQRLRLKVKFGRKVRVMSILFKSIIKTCRCQEEITFVVFFLTSPFYCDLPYFDLQTRNF